MTIGRFSALLLAACASSALSAAPVAKDQLLVQPPSASHYVVVSAAGKHGDQWAWTQPDGTLASRYSQSLRGWITETDEVMALGPDGLPTRIVIRGVTPNGDAAESFAVSDGKARWTSTADSGEVAAAPGFYLATGGTNMANIPLVTALVKAGFVDEWLALARRWQLAKYRAGWACLVPERPRDARQGRHAERHRPRRAQDRPARLAARRAAVAFANLARFRRALFRRGRRDFEHARGL